MKRLAIISALLLICLAATPDALAQKKGCGLNIVGTWTAEKPDGPNPILYRFTDDARVTVLSGTGQDSKPREIASAVYTLDDPKAPKVIIVKADKVGGIFGEGTTPMEITAHDDTSVTFKRPGSEPTRWVRVDPCRYYLVLAGRTGTFYDGSGPTFPILIKTDGEETQIDAVGIYSVRGHWTFGTIPREVYSHFMREPHLDSEVMLRLEITAVQYERGLKVIRTWERRARNKELLYPDPFMDNIVLAKQITEGLNQCGETVKLHNLDWSINDHISVRPLDDSPVSRVPFLYFKELKRLNESLHVSDAKYYGRMRAARKEVEQ